MPTIRALIYVRGTDEEIQAQLARAYAGCESSGHHVVAVMREQPDQVSAWLDAHRMLHAGEVDLVFVASGAVVPDVLESATGGIPGRTARPAGRLPASHRRTRPVQRGGGGA